MVAAVGVHELGLLQEVVERPPGLGAQRGRAALHGRVALDRGQGEDGEGELPRGVVVVRGLGRVGERGQREHALGPGHEVSGHLVLESGVEAGVVVEPVECHRAVEVAHVGARSLESGRPIGPELVERAAREGLVAGEEPGQREARQVLGGPLPRRPPRLERRQAGERVALRDEEAGVRGQLGVVIPRTVRRRGDCGSLGTRPIGVPRDDKGEQREAEDRGLHFRSFEGPASTAAPSFSRAAS